MANKKEEFLQKLINETGSSLKWERCNKTAIEKYITSPENISRCISTQYTKNDNSVTIFVIEKKEIDYNPDYDEMMEVLKHYVYVLKDSELLFTINIFDISRELFGEFLNMVFGNQESNAIDSLL